MAIEAPVSKYRIKSLKIYAMGCVIGAVVLAYDGYLSKYSWSCRQDFYKEHTVDGKPDDTMRANQILPLPLLILAALFVWRRQVIKTKKLAAADNQLIIDDREKIAYDSIEKLDKTNFKSKGYFVITYKDQGGGEVNRKISDRMYDNLEAVLNEVVSKIS
jgi:hypothetical protein